MKQIQDISVEGVKYINESGESRFIGLKECNQNWIKYRSRTENLKTDEVQEIIRKDKTIGQRVIDANPPYFEFLQDPLHELNLNLKTHFNSLEILSQKLAGVQLIYLKNRSSSTIVGITRTKVMLFSY